MFTTGIRVQCRGFKRVKGAWAWGIWLCIQDDTSTHRPHYGSQGKSQTDSWLSIQSSESQGLM